MENIETSEGTPHFDKLSNAWAHSLSEVTRRGMYSEDDGHMLLEVLGLVFTLEDCTIDEITERNADAGRVALMVEKYASLEAVPPYTKSYGALFRDFNGIDQVSKVVDLLRKKRTTKSATITFHDAADEELSCISLMDFKIRDDRLYTSVFYRSQNIFGSQPGNIVAIGHLIEEIVARVGCNVGPTRFDVASAHVYEEDLASAWATLEQLQGLLGPPKKSTTRAQAEQRTVSKPTLSQIAEEWDQVAKERHIGILRGEDLSYEHVLVPALLSMSRHAVPDSPQIIDAGCGTGLFAQALGSELPRATIWGIDPSLESVSIAQSLNVPNATFVGDTIESFVAGREGSADLVIGNMLLQNVGDLGGCLTAIRSAMKVDASFVFALPHPCFWARYWGYDQLPEYTYWQEVWIRAPFRTTLSRQQSITTHAHRPLSLYFEQFRNCGFRVAELREPTPPEGVESRYRHAWKFPRFLVGRLVAV